MTAHMQLIQKKLKHLQRMQQYLSYSDNQVKQFLGKSIWKDFTPEQHADLAAFRVRFSEFQEHLGKTMRAIAIEEEQVVEGFGSVLSFMEKLAIIDSSETWKAIREDRNSINHEYEDDPVRLAHFFYKLIAYVPTLNGYYNSLCKYCAKAYKI